MNPYLDGYYAGLVNDRSCPHFPCSPSWFAWHAGNGVGLDVHCAVVEHAYHQSMEDVQ